MPDARQFELFDATDGGDAPGPAPEQASVSAPGAASPPDGTLPDAEARARIETDLDTSLLVEAGAGSGKTRSMVRRMVALVRTGRASVDQIAAVTFTRKAAAELKERFRESLEAAARDAADAEPEVARRMDRALRAMDRGFVGTIHSFCARLLRERPLEARLDPGFRELTAAEELRYRRAFWRVYLERVAQTDPGSVERLRAVGLRPESLEGLFRTMDENADVTFPTPPAEPPEPEWVAGVRAQLEQLLREAESLLPDREPDRGWDELQTAVRTLRFRRDYRSWNDDPGFLEALHGLASTRLKITQKRWSDTKAGKQAAKTLLQRFQGFVDDDGPAGRLLRQWYAHRYPVALDFAREAARAFRRERRRTGRLTFQDLLLNARDLLRGHPAARDDLARRYRYLLVDEFQDTDPIQAEVVLLLAGRDPAVREWTETVPRDGALFVVGDPKQSIYRFRRADIAIYNQVKRRFQAWRDEGVGDVVVLNTNFRSTPPIRDLVNRVFGRLFPAGPSDAQAAFVPMVVHRDDAPRQGADWYVVQPERAQRGAIVRDDAPRIASWIEARVRAGERRPGDFMLLTGKRHNLDAYARELEARNVPVQVTGAGVGIREEISELRLLLEALADPTNAVLGVAALTGIFFGLDHEQLTAHALRHRERGSRTFDFQRPWPEPDTEVERALGTLHRFLRRVRQEPADVAVAGIADELGLVPYAAAGELGESRAGALVYVLNAIQAGAVEGETSLRDALDALSVALEADEAEAPLEPNRPGAVRLMNLHKAKGLEAPVVVLIEPAGERDHDVERHIHRHEDGHAEGWLRVTDAGKNVIARPADWEAHAERERAFGRAEDDRLLYVAATRARDELVIAHFEKKKEKSPWTPLRTGLLERRPLDIEIRERPARETVTLSPEEARALEQDAAARRDDSAEPRYHAASVTARVKGGGADSDRAAAARRERVARAAWVAGRPAEQAEPGLAGPRGTEWGSVVHEALEAAGRGAEGNRLRAICRGLLIDAERPLDPRGDPVELGTLLHIVERVMASPIWERAAAASALLIEVPFALPAQAAEYRAMTGAPERDSAHGDEARVRDGDAGGDGAAPDGHPGAEPDRPSLRDRLDAASAQVVDGVIDLAFREADGWVVVDYKTDRDPQPDHVERYRRQVDLYAGCLERLTGEPVAERVLLFTQGEIMSW